MMEDQLRAKVKPVSNTLLKEVLCKGKLYSCQQILLQWQRTVKDKPLAYQRHRGVCLTLLVRVMTVGAG